MLAAAYGVTVAWDLAKPPAGDQAVGLARWLQEHELRQGYGPYWDASIVTASGRGRVAVRPVRGREVWPGRLVIEPFRWMSDEAWYRGHAGEIRGLQAGPGPQVSFPDQRIRLLSLLRAAIGAIRGRPIRRACLG